MEGALGLSEGVTHRAKNSAVEMLRAATRLPLRSERLAYAQISDAIENVEASELADHQADPEAWVYKLALIYAHQTGLLPAFSNCENETRFERFVFALPQPLKLTRNRLKAIVRRLNLKNNIQFGRDLDALNSGLPPTVRQSS
jgi:hypothetical protein